MPIATMTSKGQITIPKKVRDVLGLHSGDRLKITFEKEGCFFVTPVKKNVDDLFGKLFNPSRATISIEAINEVLRQKFQQEKQ